MLTATLHALRRHRPYLGLKVDLIPPGANHLTRAPGRQDGEFQSSGRNTFHRPKPTHELRNVGKGHRCMVTPGQSRSHGQQLVQMSAPPKRVFAGAMAMRFGEVPHPLAAAAQAVCRLRSGLPQRPKYAQRILGGELGHRLAADSGAIIVARLFGAAILGHHFAEQGHTPLRAVLGIAPTWCHALDQFAGGGVEGEFASGFGQHRFRITAEEYGPATCLGQFSRILQRHIARRAKANGPLLTAALDHKHPSTAIGTIDLQIEATAVTVPAWSTAAEQRCYLPGREEVPGHVHAPPNAANVTPNVTLGWRLGKRGVEGDGGEVAARPRKQGVSSMVSEDDGG